MRRQRGDKRGMTLVELIVAMALSAVLVAAAALALAASFRLYNRSAALSEMGILKSTLYTAISDELHYARLDTALTGENEELRYRSSIHGGTQVEMRLENGYVTVDGRELLGDSVYGGYKVSDLTFEDGGEGCIKVTCVLENKLYSSLGEDMEMVVRILNGWA
ncbi:MAG: prepilin-type N-terminal cleavage/methylation domain-containing protein [Lachnospiraceae bacterium]|jgi:prepilin-type N-terminal cleavage/methylation domain-containing protein|nr:prepilin-type N-terminal cleavage/methylation domain-containing protein [Lachnospiraceae bacterium]